MVKIDFYYWGVQCPHNEKIKNLLLSFKNNKKYHINFYDVSESHKVAKKINMYSPSLLIFNEKYRWNGPITKSKIQEIGKGNYPNKKPYTVKLSNESVTGKIRKLTEERVLDTYKPCGISSVNKGCCVSKGKWIKKIRNKYNIPYLGMLHYVDGECVGGAEFVPSLEVPYSIPKNKDIAFLTCSFLSDNEFDYRSLPLEKLEKKLPEMGFRELIAVVSEQVVFPNGTLEWFINKNYKDLGNFHYEKNDFAKMHLVKKKL